MVELSGSPKEKFKAICSAVDKLDKVVFKSIYLKEPWSEVKRELVEDKGLTVEMADKIGEFVKFTGMKHPIKH
jgi:histidyl-tRNA synthetase